jgi:hypothetical protein
MVPMTRLIAQRVLTRKRFTWQETQHLNGPVSNK